MSNIVIRVILVCVCFNQYSCHKTPTQNDLDRSFAEQFQFMNSATTTNLYFKGVLDDQNINYSDGMDNYGYIQEISTSSDINGNSFPTSNTINNDVIFTRSYSFRLPIEKARNKPNSWLDITLMGPSSKILFKADSLLKNYLENKGAIGLNRFRIFRDKSATSNDSLGFSFNLNMQKYINDYSGYSTFSLVTERGDQAGSFIKIKDVKKEVGIDYDNYYVIFSFQCKLYFDFDYSSPFKTLYNGEMRVKIVLPH